MQTECLLDAPPSALVRVRVRFLRVRPRAVEAATAGRTDDFTPVSSLDTGDRLWTSWEEATEHEIEVAPCCLGSLTAETSDSCDPILVEHAIDYGDSIDIEELREPAGSLVGRVVRRQWAVSGRIEVTATALGVPGGLTKLRIRVENLTDWTGSRNIGREETVRRSLVAVHVLAALDEGRFISLLDPEERARSAALECKNVGAFPVLIGDGDDDVILSSPIILYDHPEIAPESQGDMFDATEIDEILALRVLTLTDEEKREARGTDDLAASIIDRCDAMPPEIFERLHGAVRSLRSSTAAGTPPEPALKDRQPQPFGQSESFGQPKPAAQPEPELNAAWWDPENDAGVDPATDTLVIGGVEVGRGARVRLNPTRRADAQDFFLAGRSALVTGVFHDVDGGDHLAVVLDDDPASELHDWYGRYLYFYPDEVVVMGGSS